MKNTGIWIDGTKAVIVELPNESVTEVLARIDNKVHHANEGDKGTYLGGGHFNNNESKFDERKNHQIKDYLKNVVNEMSDSNNVYIFGPSEMKKHLKTFIEEDKANSINVTAVEAAEKMTNNQIVAAVKTYFEN
jgi:stalled ribosome rescue protein Dom34